MTFVDDLIGYKRVTQLGASELPQRDTLCFANGALVTDDAVHDQTLVRVAGADGGFFGALSPALITVDQPNYNPTGWSDADLVRIASGAEDTVSLLGLAPPAPLGRTRKTLVNVGEGTIALPNMAAGAPASSRIAHPYGAAYELLPFGSIDVLYSTSDARWFLIP